MHVEVRDAYAELVQNDDSYPRMLVMSVCTLYDTSLDLNAPNPDLVRVARLRTDPDALMDSWKSQDPRSYVQNMDAVFGLAQAVWDTPLPKVIG